MSYYTPKSEIIKFIINSDTIYPKPNNLNESMTLRELKDMLQQVIKNREDELVENRIHRDDWPDDDILGQAEEYIDELNENRLANEEKNIEFTRNVSSATQNTKLPPEMKNKIMSYGLEDPKVPTYMYKTIKKLGGKSRNKSRSKSRRKSKRKSRRNKKNTRKHRK